jgi:ADP-heptose:LPS heptosyltransferase
VKRPRLVILRALGLGDLLTAVPALRGLAEAFPDHHRVLLAPRALTPLLELIRDTGGRPVIDEPLDTAALTRLDGRLGNPAVAVNLHGRGPQSHRLLLELEPARLIAFAHRGVPESRSGPPWWAQEHEVTRWCRLLGDSDIACEPAALDIDRPSPGAARRLLARGATLLHPGAASAARRWPPERWAAVAAAESSAGRSVVISGGCDEVDLARRVARAARLAPASVIAGQTDLGQLAAAVDRAGRVVCSDTGVAHLATALGTPSVVLFGPTSPDLWGPPAARAEHRALWKGSGRGDPHGEEPDADLMKIGIGDVLDALRRLPRSHARAGGARPSDAGARAA